MSAPRHSAARKIAAVRRVAEDGCSVCDVAREMGVSKGSLFFWMRRYRQFAPTRTHAHGDAANEVGSLVAYLRRTRAR
ncbi:MAG: transposase [Pseudomonadota bacterium]|nr:transposase [Pseudomonadota bacterium]